MERPIELTSIEEYEKIKSQDLAVIFKHSTQCGTSAGAHREVQKFMAENPRKPVYMVLVIENKDVSKHIEKDTKIQHESPQVIVMRNGSAKWHANHKSIEFDKIEAHA